jgi:hypothetical protein
MLSANINQSQVSANGTNKSRQTYKVSPKWNAEEKRDSGLLGHGLRPPFPRLYKEDARLQVPLPTAIEFPTLVLGILE